MPLSSLSKIKIALCECVSIIMDWIDSPSRINTLCLWSQCCWTNSIMLRCTPRLIYMEYTIWCAFEKAINVRQCSKSIMAIWNILWCHLVLLTRLLFSNILWTMSFVSTWIILWFVTLMTSSFFQTTWRTKSVMYVWFWRSFGRLDFTSNWKNVNSINLKWNS
jgi:hypothetical protein